MKAIGSSRPSPDLLRLVSHARKDESKAYSGPERARRRGIQLVVGGFAIAMLGIVAYTIVALGADAESGLGWIPVESRRWLVLPALGAIGLGLLFWFVGCFTYLNAEMDIGPTDTTASK